MALLTFDTAHKPRQSYASMAVLLRIEWESRTVLGSEDADFSEADFDEAPPVEPKEVRHGR